MAATTNSVAISAVLTNELLFGEKSTSVKFPNDISKADRLGRTYIVGLADRHSYLYIYFYKDLRFACSVYKNI